MRGEHKGASAIETGPEDNSSDDIKFVLTNYVRFLYGLGPIDNPTQDTVDPSPEAWQSISKRIVSAYDSLIEAVPRGSIKDATRQVANNLIVHFNLGVYNDYHNRYAKRVTSDNNDETTSGRESQEAASYSFMFAVFYAQLPSSEMKSEFFEGISQSIYPGAEVDSIEASPYSYAIRSLDGPNAHIILDHLKFAFDNLREVEASEAVAKLMEEQSRK